jgi:hypothetical protein
MVTRAFFYSVVCSVVTPVTTSKGIRLWRTVPSPTLLRCRAQLWHPLLQSQSLASPSPLYCYIVHPQDKSFRRKKKPSRVIALKIEGLGPYVILSFSEESQCSVGTPVPTESLPAQNSIHSERQGYVKICRGAVAVPLYYKSTLLQRTNVGAVREPPLLFQIPCWKQ